MRIELVATVNLVRLAQKIRESLRMPIKKFRSGSTRPQVQKTGKKSSWYPLTECCRAAKLSTCLRKLRKGSRERIADAFSEYVNKRRRFWS
jgi:hypothetical protein